MTNTKKWLAAIALLFVGYTIGEDAPDTLGANYTTPAPVQSDVSSELNRLTKTPVPVATGCWVEHKEDGSTEVLSGDLALMPVGSELISCDDRFQLPADSSPEAIGDAPKYTEMHGDTRSQKSAAPARPTPSAADEKPKPAPTEKPVQQSEPSAAPAKPAAPSSGLVNLNTASQSELEALPGVGEKTAQKIMAARPLASVGAVDAMPGVRFAEFKDLVTV